MKFVKFVTYLEELEKISSRLAITDLLAKLLRELDDEEVDKGVYLVLGMLGPSFDNTQFNMAAKLVMRSVAMGTEKEVSLIEKEYKKKGDLGEVLMTENFKKEKIKAYSLGEVFEKLMAIALEAGEGSQEKKVVSLYDLLNSVSKLERKYIGRMVMGKLRLGFSEKTIFDALSMIESGSKTLRKELDQVFQIYPDAGLITSVFKDKGLVGLKRIAVKTGVPVVPALCQRLNEYGEIISKMKDVAVERKYDGTRVQIHFDRKNKLLKTYTRNLEENSWMFPELLKMGDWVKADRLILDCEAVGIDTKTGKVLPFQMTITRKRKHGVEETAQKIPLRFFVFDVLSEDDQSLIERPYFERRKRLLEVIKKNETLVVDEYKHVDEPKEVQELHDQYLKEGYEGAVIKKWDGDYLPGRQGWNWVKIKEAEGTEGKLSDTLDLVIMGYYYGRGKRSGFGMGAFLVGLIKEGKWTSVAKIGTGLTDEEFKGLKERLESKIVMGKPKNYEVEGNLKCDVWVEPEVVVEIAADEITKSPTHAGGLALRFPRLIKFRDDKGAEQATSWKELLTIAKLHDEVK